MKGQSTFEILIALAIFAIAATSGFFLLFNSQSFSVDTNLNHQAIYIAQQNLENARITALSNFNGLTSSSSTNNGFLNEIIVSSTDIFTKYVTNRTSWQTTSTRPQKVEFKTIFTNLQAINSTPNPNSSGGSGVTGDWTQPQILGQINLGPNEQATGLRVINKIVYMSTSVSNPSKPDFFIIDATNGQNPVIVTSINTGNNGLNAVDVAGNYAYVANNFQSNQLQIIDISNLSAPFVAKNFTLPGVTGDGAVGNAILYARNKIYIGTQKANGPEFHIIDVTSSTNPVELGSFKINADVNGIYVWGNTAYLAISNINNVEMEILDVSDPVNIRLINAYSAPSGDNSRSLYLADPLLYLGRVAGSMDFMILNVSTSSAPQLLSAANLGGASINGIRVRDNLAFLAASASNQQFQVWNISSSTNPTLWSTLSFPNIATGIDYENNYIYVSLRSNDGLRILTSK